MEALRDEGRPLPLVLRFPQILEARVQELNEAFRRAMEKYGYRGTYRGVYPVKVNQRRLVLETVAKAGKAYHFGLEAGSKAELASSWPRTSPRRPHHHQRLQGRRLHPPGLMGRKLGRNVVLTLEKFAELPRVVRLSQELGVKPLLGLRYKLKAKGAGQWEASGGENAKFGLTTRRSCGRWRS